MTSVMTPNDILKHATEYFVQINFLNPIQIVVQKFVDIYRITIRGIRTISKFRLLTKIDFNVMYLVSLCKKNGKNCKFVAHETCYIMPGLNFGATAAGNSYGFLLNFFLPLGKFSKPNFTT